MTPRASRALFRVGATVAVLGVLVGACGGGEGQELSAGGAGGSATSSEVSTSSTLPGLYEGFRLVGDEAVGLNGRENEGRPPIQFLLLASETDPDVTEAELVDLYVDELRESGWEIVSYEPADEWWTMQGIKGASFLRVGTASFFDERAKASEGYSRIAFRELAAENPGPMIVVSIDPAV